MERTRMIIADLQLEPVVRVHPGTSLAQAARALADTAHGVLVVGSDPIDEVTETDVVDALASGRPPLTHLDAICHGAPVFVGRDTPVYDATAMMIAGGRRALVVVEHDEPIGVIPLRAALDAHLGGESWVGALRLALHVTDH